MTHYLVQIESEQQIYVFGNEDKARAFYFDKCSSTNKHDINVNQVDDVLRSEYRYDKLNFDYYEEII